MTTLIVQSLKMTLIFTVLTGLAYPLLITGIAQSSFHEKANGSLQTRDGRIVGSTLLAQKFESPRFFWPRPSASDYGAVPSGASNLGPTSQALRSNVLARLEVLRGAHRLPENIAIPADMVFQSGSGVDPHISPGAAVMQIHRIAHARNIPENRLETLVAQSIEPPQFGLLGEPRVNVLLLNLAMERL